MAGRIRSRRARSMASDIGSRHTLTTLRSCVGCTLELVSGVETELETPSEVSFQVAGAVQVFALVEGHLLEDVVLPSGSLFLLEQQVVSAGDLVVFIVLNECSGLF